MNKNIILIINDLVLRQQVKSKFEGSNFFFIRNEQELDSALKENVDYIFIDLTHQKLDVFNLIQKIENKELITCFYPHIEKDKALKAHNLGVEKIYTRGKFFTEVLISL